MKYTIPTALGFIFFVATSGLSLPSINDKIASCKTDLAFIKKFKQQGIIADRTYLGIRVLDSKKTKILAEERRKLAVDSKELDSRIAQIEGFLKGFNKGEKIDYNAEGCTTFARSLYKDLVSYQKIAKEAAK